MYVEFASFRSSRSLWPALSYNRGKHQSLIDRTQTMLAIGHDLKTPLSRMKLRLDDESVDPEIREGISHDIDEMRLLLEFSSAPGTVLSRDKLLERVWDYGWGGDTRVVDVHVQRLRTKIGQDRIETVRGFGYKLKA